MSPWGMVDLVDADIRNRAIAGVVMVGVMGLGVQMSGATERASQEKIEQISAKEVTAKAAETEALSRELTFKSVEEFFAVRIAADLAQQGLAGMSLDELKQPQAFFDELKDPVTLRPGKTWTSPHFSVKASTEKVRFQQRGAMIAAQHSVATVKNESDSPIAYFMKIGPADERACQARGARMHNAMALLPGETAEIAVCAGDGAVRISEAKVLETTPLGYVYFSRLPPVAVLHDAVTGQAHRPQGKIDLCTGVPAVRLAAFLKSGEAQWKDLADFYTRHPCDLYQFSGGYKHADKPLLELPAVRATGAR